MLITRRVEAEAVVNGCLLDSQHHGQPQYMLDPEGHGVRGTSISDSCQQSDRDRIVNNSLVELHLLAKRNLLQVLQKRQDFLCQ